MLSKKTHPRKYITSNFMTLLDCLDQLEGISEVSDAINVYQQSLGGCSSLLCVIHKEL